MNEKKGNYADENSMHMSKSSEDSRIIFSNIPPAPQFGQHHTYGREDLFQQRTQNYNLTSSFQYAGYPTNSPMSAIMSRPNLNPYRINTNLPNQLANPNTYGLSSVHNNGGSSNSSSGYESDHHASSFYSGSYPNVSRPMESIESIAMYNATYSPQSSVTPVSVSDFDLGDQDLGVLNPYACIDEAPVLMVQQEQNQVKDSLTNFFSSFTANEPLSDVCKDLINIFTESIDCNDINLILDDIVKNDFPELSNNECSLGPDDVNLLLDEMEFQGYGI